MQDFTEVDKTYLNLVKVDLSISMIKVSRFNIETESQDEEVVGLGENVRSYVLSFDLFVGGFHRVNSNHGVSEVLSGHCSTTDDIVWMT